MARRRCAGPVWVGREPDYLDMCLGPDGVYWDGIPWSARLVVCQRFWRDHRDEILADWSQPGRRPWAWWEFDADEAMPPLDDESGRLAELGELAPEEQAAAEELMAHRVAANRRTNWPRATGRTALEEERHDG